MVKIDEQASQSSIFKVMLVNPNLQEPKVLDAWPENLHFSSGTSSSLPCLLLGFFAWQLQAALLVFFDFFASAVVVRSIVVIQQSDDK